MKKEWGSRQILQHGFCFLYLGRGLIESVKWVWYRALKIKYRDRRRGIYGKEESGKSIIGSFVGIYCVRCFSLILVFHFTDR